MKAHLALVGALLISAASSPAWADLVTNGNFSGGDATVCHDQTCPGWSVIETTEGYTALLFNDENKGVTVPAGVGFVSFGAGGPGEDEVYQVLPTVAGDEYKVSFEFATSGDAPEKFSAVFGSTTIYSETDTSNGNVLTPYTFDVTATSSNTTLAFFGMNSPGTNVLAEVSVVSTTTTLPPPPTIPPPPTTLPPPPTRHHHHLLVGLDPPDNLPVLVGLDPPGVPESSTWAMMLLGFAGLGFAAFRRKISAFG
jgi:hypothetical protein